MSAPFVVLNLQTDGSNVLEIGSVVVDARGLFELERWSSLIKGKVTQHACITSRMTEQAPPFEAIAAHLHRILHNKIWAGHHITLAQTLLPSLFSKAGMQTPTPLGLLDTSKLFAPRDASSSLASLAKQFGLGTPTLRAQDDASLNAELFRRGCAISFLEHSFPQWYPGAISSAVVSSAAAAACSSVASSKPAPVKASAPTGSILGSINAASAAAAPVAAAPPAAAVAAPVASTGAQPPNQNQTKKLRNNRNAGTTDVKNNSGNQSGQGNAAASDKQPKPKTGGRPPLSPKPKATPHTAAVPAMSSISIPQSPAKAVVGAPVSPSFVPTLRAPPSPLLKQHVPEMPLGEWGLIDDDVPLPPPAAKPAKPAKAAAPAVPTVNRAAKEVDDDGWETVGGKRAETTLLINDAIKNGTLVSFAYPAGPKVTSKARVMRVLKWEHEPSVFVAVVAKERDGQSHHFNTSKVIGFKKA